jgi:hypothetical protein
MSFLISVRLSVRPFVRIKLGSHWTDFHEILYFNIFLRFVTKIQDSLKSDKNSGTLHEWVKLRSDKSNIENKNTHFVFNNFFIFENPAVYEKMWKNILQPVWPQMTIGRMRIACWITKATHTHTQYVTLINFPHQPWLYERASILGYT